MFYASHRNQMVRHVFHAGSLPSNDEHLQAVPMIEVHVQGRDYRIEVGVLQLRQSFLDM